MECPEIPLMWDHVLGWLLSPDSGRDSFGNSVVYRKSPVSATGTTDATATGPRSSAPSSGSLRGARGSSGSALGSAPTIAVLGATAVAAAALRKKDSQAVKATALQAFENELGVGAAPCCTRLPYWILLVATCSYCRYIYLSVYNIYI